MRPTHQNCVFISHSGRVGESNFIIKTVSPKSDMAINCMFASKRMAVNEISMAMGWHIPEKNVSVSFEIE